MANWATVKDGKLEYDYTDNSKKQEALGSNLGYDQFLQLLCAEMQYQDPLEPTSNTEYVAQLATFSQLEAMLSLENTQQTEMANSLVGKTVIMKVTNENTGKVTYVDGKVDYVMYQNDETYLSVNDKLYPLSDLDTVADNEYYEAMGLAKSITNMLEQLPDIDNINKNHEELVKQITDLYDGMTSYQQQFVSDDTKKVLQAYRDKIAEVLKREENAQKPDDNIADSGEDTKTDTDTDAGAAADGAAADA